MNLENINELITLLKSNKLPLGFLKDCENKVLKIRDKKLSYKFAKEIKGADVLAHGRVIIESNDLEYNYYFARDVKGANIKEHEKVILNSLDPKYNYYFVRDISKDNIKAHEEKIKMSKSEYWYSEFCKLYDIKYVDIDKINAILDEEIKRLNLNNYL